MLANLKSEQAGLAIGYLQIRQLTLSTPTLLYGLKALKKLHMCHFASYALKSQRKCHEALKRKCYQASERSASRPAQKVPSGLHRKSGKPAQHFQCSSSGAGHITKNWESMASFKRFWQKKKKRQFFFYLNRFNKKSNTHTQTHLKIDFRHEVRVSSPQYYAEGEGRGRRSLPSIPAG